LHKGAGKTPAVADAASRNNKRGLALEHRRLVVARNVHHGGDQDTIGDITGMPAALTTLGANHIHPQIQRLDSMFRVAHHIHDQHPIGVQFIDNPLGRNTHGANKQFCSGLNGDVNQLIEFASGVIVVGLAGVAADLREGEVHAKGEGGVG
jgi:hypothetical protein